MGEKVQKFDADFYKFLSLLGLIARLYGNGNRTRMHT